MIQIYLRCTCAKIYKKNYKKYQNLVISKSGKSHNKIVKIVVKNFEHVGYKALKFEVKKFEHLHSNTVKNFELIKTK